jgi:hypothetical protein
MREVELVYVIAPTAAVVPESATTAPVSKPVPVMVTAVVVAVAGIANDDGLMDVIDGPVTVTPTAAVVVPPSGLLTVAAYN